MTEGSRQAVAEGGSVPSRQHQPRGAVNKQMEDGVIGCRDCTSQARLQRPSRLLDGKMSGLPQQVIMQAHEACSTSEAPRK